jgi:predicted amidohydrolase
MDATARERLRAISMGTRVIAGEKPGVYTPEAKTDGNFGAKIEVVNDLSGMDVEKIRSMLATPKEKPRTLRVAAVQFHTCFDVASNARQIVDYINRAADAGARVTVFSEMALTGYTKKVEFRNALDWRVIDEALDGIRAACKARGIYAIVGAPTKDGDKIFCTALAIDPRGQIIDRFEKTYLAGEAWATPGRRLTTFAVDGVKCGSFVCHDERYPHLVQLRALAGAQLFFYISCESGVGEEHKIGPYRAQLQARAVENGVYIVHANAPALRDNPNAEGTSNGHSRIIGPDGNLVREAGAYEDAMVIADIDLRHARKNGMPAALDDGPTARWVREGVGLVDKE